MKIQINRPIFDIDGSSPLIEKDKEMTLKDVCYNAILSFLEADDGKTKFEKYEIFKKLREAKDEVELTAEQIAIIKKGIDKFYPPLILGQAYEYIETNK